MTLGFLATPEKRAEPARSAENCMLTFDSGRGISFNDAVYHLLLLGTTGSGKTSCGFLPAVRHLLAAGHCGLLVDIKGNVRRQVRALARACGREDDIVEYGSAPTATPINLLEGMDRYGMYSFFETLTLQSFHVTSASTNVDWQLKGVNQAADCGQLLLYLSRLDPLFRPDIAVIAAMLNQPARAQELYALFKDRVYDENDDAQAQFVSNVENSRYHVLRPARKEKNVGEKVAAEDEQQMTWILQAIRQALRYFLDAPGISANFAAPGGSGLDMRQILRENKVAILRFGLDTGPIGASLARVILSRYYAAVYELGLTLPAGKKCFVCIDEYQEAADLSDNRFSDVSFISQAREFNAIFVASTQSMSALMHRSFSSAAVEAFTSNFNGRVVFYSDDPMTQAMAARYDPSLDLKELQPGEAFVVRYRHEERRHLHGREYVQREFESTRAVIEGTKTDEAPVRPAAAAQRRSLREMTEWAREKAQAGPESTAPSDENATLPRRVMPRRGEASRDDAPSVMKHIIRQQKESAMKKVQDQSGLMEKFPHLFATDEDVSISVPAGWIGFAENALTAFSASGLPVRLTSLSLEGNALRASEGESGERRRWGRSESGALGFLNALLQGADSICALCGDDMAPSAAMDGKAEGSYDDDEDDEDMPHASSRGALPICDKCLRKYRLASLSRTPGLAK